MDYDPPLTSDRARTFATPHILSAVSWLVALVTDAQAAAASRAQAFAKHAVLVK